MAIRTMLPNLEHILKGGSYLEVITEGIYNFLDLLCQLSCGCQHKTLCLTDIDIDPLHQRDGKSSSLTST